MKTFKNPISTAMAEYREDFRYNREWWKERMGNGNNNEYLWIQFKNGDNITVQADYFQMDGYTCLPRFRADEVAYLSRYYGDQCETTTAADIVVDTYRIILYAGGVEYFRYEMSEGEYKEMRRQMWELDYETDSTAWMLNYCRALATSKMDNNTDNTMKANNTPATMNETKATAIYERVEATKARGAWKNGVKVYALMLLDWYKDEASESPLTLETMLNGANDWRHYSRIGCGVALIYNAYIAETLCSPSELKRVKGGLRNPNIREDWQDVEGRALFQAWQLIKDAERLENYNA